ncbi:amidophosphoribosyltransferase [Thioclava sp. SK-1]|uniref:ComF family protein n=1 Tax=Thioclava sp. SK-1 TaxID=1889770 RepID=UPI000824F231|nr:ComF family protein [Thioclava sp. SK-1]OCX63417.1 amidophosphoribosyltransferase [Thioclava sp. SK-1]
MIGGDLTLSSNALRHRVRRGIQTGLRLIYPPRCMACNAHVTQDGALCPICWTQTPFLAGLGCDACGAPLPGGSDRAELCDDCLMTPRPWSQGRAALRYDGPVRRMILAFKHGDRTDLARPFAAWMAHAGADLFTADAVLVPIPLHRLRLIHRRYNQAALLAAELAGMAKICHMPDLFTRRRTTTQEGKNRTQRFANLTGAIQLRQNRQFSVVGRHLILIDDVMTSGATFHAATDAALEAGAARVDILSLARVAKPG